MFKFFKSNKPAPTPVTIVHSMSPELAAVAKKHNKI